ncbi:MAG: DUF5009 domain-containing protein, partial [Planctomycetaceae bacterium]|nr:DUF5009 domain-containing protein [Planctomycetaceae bacterium]
MPIAKSNSSTSSPGTSRLVSLDAYRGFIMTMLAVSGFGIAGFAALPETNEVWLTHHYARWQRISFHFEHPDWISVFDGWRVSFWDLIQPAFMFMVGVAMPFSAARRSEQQQSFGRQLLHAVWRAVVLVLLGVFLQSKGQSHTHWIFPNVLSQIGLGYVFAWLCFRGGRITQFGGLAAILIGYWLLFWLSPPGADYVPAEVNASVKKGEVLEGRFRAWSKNGNVAHRFDQWLLPKLRAPEVAASKELPDESVERNSADAATEEPAIQAPAPPAPGLLRRWFFAHPQPYPFNAGGYTTLNFVPSIATTLLGILCGQLLLHRPFGPWKQFLLLLLAGFVCLALGVLAHATVCPIVKRIWTPSWVLFSGGWVIWMLAVFYLLFDLLPLRLLAWPLVVVGANSILMYLMGQLWRGWVIENIVRRHFSGILESIFG